MSSNTSPIQASVISSNVATVEGGAAEAPKGPRYIRAYQSSLPVYATMNDEDNVPITIDVVNAVTTTEGCIGKVMVHRDDIAKHLPLFPIQKADNLETSALALGHAHTKYLSASAPAQPIQALVETCITNRDNFASDVGTAVQRGLIDGAPLKKLRGTNGHMNVAWDVRLYCNILRDNWPVLKGRTAVTEEEIDQADDDADNLIRAVGIREQGDSAVPEAAITRQRAFTHFIDSYEEVRRALMYLRYHQDDVEDILPSLYANKRAPKKDDGAGIVAEPVVAGPAPTPAAPAPVAPAPVAPSPSNGANGGVVISPTPLAGTPGSGPFVR